MSLFDRLAAAEMGYLESKPRVKAHRVDAWGTTMLIEEHNDEGWIASDNPLAREAMV
jgi:hypothetical protein